MSDCTLAEKRRSGNELLQCHHKAIERWHQWSQMDALHERKRTKKEQKPNPNVQVNRVRLSRFQASPRYVCVQAFDRTNRNKPTTTKDLLEIGPCCPFSLLNVSKQHHFFFPLSYKLSTALVCTDPVLSHARKLKDIIIVPRWTSLSLPNTSRLSLWYRGAWKSGYIFMN